uniref:Uncharacterized protein n=1 Tax=viral metagenome TaxID=1070528 RepID=A0A6C0HHD8_9ZZZZ
MKLRGIHIIFIVILVFAVLTITSSDSVVPYSKDTLFSNMYKYEGMVGMQQGNANQANPQLPPEATQPAKPPSPLGMDEFKKIMSSMGNKIAGGSDNAQQSDESKKKVEGFALQPAPFANSAVLDVFGKTPSGPQCFGRSSGYSKSLGPLCFSKEDENLLRTRGGNQSGTCIGK